MDAQRARELLGQETERIEALIDDVKVGVGEGGENESLSELSDNDQHPADLGTETFEREKDLSILESLERELRDLSAALERIDAGTYGVCEGCEQPIAEERLEAQPAARFCTEHAPRR